jgi:PPOX class probable F420-dependent enzyme
VVELRRPAGEEIVEYAERWNAEDERFGAVEGYEGDRQLAPALPPRAAQGPRAGPVTVDDRQLDFVAERRWACWPRSSGTAGPQLSNVGYAYDPAQRLFRVSVTADRAKTRNLQADPAVTLHVSSQDFWSWVAVEGTAELTAVAADPHDAAAEELVAYYRGHLRVSTRTGTTTAGRWWPTGAWSSASPPSTPTAGPLVSGRRRAPSAPAGDTYCAGTCMTEKDGAPRVGDDGEASRTRCPRPRHRDLAARGLDGGDRVVGGGDARSRSTSPAARRGRPRRGPPRGRSPVAKVA